MNKDQEDKIGVILICIALFVVAVFVAAMSYSMVYRAIHSGDPRTITVTKECPIRF